MIEASHLTEFTDLAICSVSFFGLSSTCKRKWPTSASCNVLYCAAVDLVPRIREKTFRWRRRVSSYLSCPVPSFHPTLVASQILRRVVTSGRKVGSLHFACKNDGRPGRKLGGTLVKHFGCYLGIIDDDQCLTKHLNGADRTCTASVSQSTQ